MSDLSMSVEDFTELLAGEECTFRIISTHHERYHERRLEVHVWPREDAPPQVWHVICRGVWEEGSTRDNLGKFRVQAEHPLLWRFVHPNMALWFYDRPRSVNEMIGSLYRVHDALVGKALPFEQFLGAIPLPRLLDGGHGLLARGPKPLIEAYQDALKAQHVACSFLLYPVPRRINTPVDKPLRLLRIHGLYYVVEDLEIRTSAGE